MAGRRYASFREFYPFYLTEHSRSGTRRLHFAGTLLVLLTLAYALATQRWAALALLPALWLRVRVGGALLRGAEPTGHLHLPALQSGRRLPDVRGHDAAPGPLLARDVLPAGTAPTGLCGIAGICVAIRAIHEKTLTRPDGPAALGFRLYRLPPAPRPISFASRWTRWSACWTIRRSRKSRAPRCGAQDRRRSLRLQRDGQARPRHARASRTPEQKQEFVALFSDLLDRAYFSKIEQYQGERSATGPKRSMAIRPP